MKLTDISLKRPVFATVIILALLAIGAVSFKGLPLTSMPDVDPPYVTVTIVQPGASPEQMETKISKKVEDAVGQVSGVKHISTTISQSVSSTLIEFELEKPSGEAIQEVRDKLGLVRADLPDDIEEPTIAKYDSTATPILSLAVTGSMDKQKLSQLVEDKIKKPLAMLEGIGEISLYGNAEREIQIKLDKEKLAAYSITASEVVSILQKQNLDVPSGTLSSSSGEMTLRTDASVRSVGDFEQISIASRNDVQILLKDIGEVIDGTSKQDSLAYYQGEDAISLDIIKQSGGNTVAIVNNIKAKISEIQKSLPSGVTINIVSDGSVSVKSTVNSVIKTMVEGCVLAVLIVFIFLGEPRLTAISAISLPTSIISTFTALKLFGFSLNLMTLIALSLAVGLLVDDAIVVLENIVRHLQVGKSPLQAAKDGTSEIGLAVTATTLAVVAVFIPIAMVKGMIGKYFVQFGLTIVFSLLVSLFVSFTLVPVLSAKCGKQEEKGSSLLRDTFNRAFEAFTHAYTKLLNLVLRRRFVTLALVITLFLSSICIFSKLSTSTVPQQDIGEIDLIAEMDSGMNLEQASLKAKEIENILKKQPEVQYVYTKVQANEANFLIKLPDKSEREKGVKQIAEEIRGSLKQVSGLNLSVNINMGTTYGKEIVYHIQGSDYKQLQEYAQKVKQMMSEISAVRDISISDKAGSPETKLGVDQNMADELGVTPASVSATLHTLFSGVIVSQYNTGKDSYDVRLSISDDQSQNIDSLNGIYVSGANSLVPLSQVTKTTYSTSEASITRYEKEREIQISANLYGLTTGDFSKRFMKDLNSKVGMPDGIAVSAGGTEAAAGGGTSQLAVASLMGILFIYLILAAQFESFIIPLSILLSLPLAIIGAIFAMFLTNSEVSMTAMIGLILLMGLVTKNAILLVDNTIHQRRAGMERKEALLMAGNIRLRPIMMTSLAMIFGMIPAALSKEMGSEITAPMAIVIIGGLISSTLLTLFVVPIMYTLLDDVQCLFTRFWKRLKKEKKEIISC